MVDGLARPGGQTERHLSHMVQRRVERAARPARTGPIRFGTLTADNHRESRGMARGIVRRKDHRSAVAFLRQVFEDDPGGALPEAMQLADRVEDLDRKQGARFRADLVKMLGVVQPTFAPIMAAGRIPEGGSTHVGATLLSGAAFSAKADGAAGPTAGVPPARADHPADAVGRVVPRNTDSQARPSPHPAGLLGRMAPPSRSEADPGQEYLERRAHGTQEERAGFADRAWVQFKALEKDWRQTGWHRSAAFMKHYLSAKGGSHAVTREEALEIETIRDAAAKNRERVENSFVEWRSPSGLAHEYYKRILLSPDGARNVDLTSDHWQVAGGRKSLAWNLFLGDRDFARSFGRLAVNADVTARASRDGDTVTVEGAVEHWLFDLYDFETQYEISENAAVMEEFGRAQRFDVGAGWKQRFTATIRIVDGRPRIEEFTWVDTDETVDWRHNEVKRKERTRHRADPESTNARNP